MRVWNGGVYINVAPSGVRVEICCEEEGFRGGVAAVCVTPSQAKRLAAALLKTAARVSK